MISFIVPAYNEAAQIREVVESIQRSADEIAAEYEIIVVDDDSEDGTLDIARAAGAEVLSVKKRQIAAVRNAGARHSTGDILVFVDGDTFLNETTLAAAIRTLDGGAIGGGTLFRFDDAPVGIRVGMWLTLHGLRLFGLCGGCFMFMTREAFEHAGGFDEKLYATEEVTLARALREGGRFVVLRDPVVTSGRKARRYSTITLIFKALRIGARGPKGVRRREGLEIWYDGYREATQRDGDVTNDQPA